MLHDTLVRIFFTITAAAVIVITVLLAIGTIYLITIFRAVKRIVRTAEFASEVIRDDVMELRNNIKQKGFSMGAFAGFLGKLAKHSFSSKDKKK